MSDIIIVLDESGSMESMGKEPVQAMNKFIRDQKAADPNSRITIYTFSTNVRKVVDNVLLSEMKEYSDYKPDGMTALYDCIGRAVSDKMVAGRKDHVVMVIITDGQDNSSREYNAQKIKTMISEKEKDLGWEVIFLAANQDSFQAGNSVGVTPAKCAGFQPQRGSLTAAVDGISSQVSAYRHLSSQGKYKSINLTSN